MKIVFYCRRCSKKFDSALKKFSHSVVYPSHAEFLRFGRYEVEEFDTISYQAPDSSYFDISRGSVVVAVTPHAEHGTIGNNRIIVEAIYTSIDGIRLSGRGFTSNLPYRFQLSSVISLVSNPRVRPTSTLSKWACPICGPIYYDHNQALHQMERSGEFL